MSEPEIFELREIRRAVQDSNLNFFIGSGLSVPYFGLLKNIEKLLVELSATTGLTDDTKDLIKVSLYKRYFDIAIDKNIEILNADASCQEVLNNYKKFLISINSILLKRKTSIFAKQANIYTTNIDIFIKQALEDSGLEFNDGFGGRFKPVFQLGNFKKSLIQRSSHYDNISEIPIFNLLKIHGSVTWKRGKEDDSIVFSGDLAQVKKLRELADGSKDILEVKSETTIRDLVKAADKKTANEKLKEFLKQYEELLIINPEKEKFKQSLLNQNYYELLRIYANELEKESAVLFVLGFSFSDDHIRQITLRAANSNPTLIIYVLAYDHEAEKDLREKLNVKMAKNRNIKIIAPLPTDAKKFNLEGITEEIFNKILDFAGTQQSGESQ